AVAYDCYLISTFFDIYLRRPPISPLFPYTTLFRSHAIRKALDAHIRELEADERFPMLPQRLVMEVREVMRGEDIIAAHDLAHLQDRKSTRLNSSHVSISYAVFCLKKKKKRQETMTS